MEVWQIFLTLVIGIVAIILTITGIQLIIVLRNIKTLLRRVNLVIEGFERASGFFFGLKNISYLINFLIKKIKKDDKQ